MADHDELYTGYLPQAPPRIAAWTKKTVVALFAVAAAVALALAAGQSAFSRAVYEFGVVEEVEGVVRAAPYPTLEVARPGGAVSRFFLVDPFKHGATVDGLDGRRVRARGSLIYRDDRTMLEILPDETETLGPGAAAGGGAERSFGVRTLTGRIVDSKCYLGIMKPGSGKSHRACAARCISGGIPPLFEVRDARGPVVQLLLVDAAGGAVNDRVLHLVDEPLEIRGEVTRLDDLWILKADPETYRRP